MTANRFQLRVLCFLLCAISAASVCGAERVAVTWVTEGPLRVEVRGVDPTAKPEALLRVYVAAEGLAPDADEAAVAGTYRHAPGVLTFEPLFPPAPGVTYRAVVRGADKPLTSEFTAPAVAKRAAAEVVQVYPSADELPENLLKFYAHFSAPMRRGGIYEHIRLLDEAGKEIELPFLEIDEELWDPEMKRLTLFIDPGRIKRGVQPLEDVGPALVEGKRFTLQIDGGLTDASGQPLARPFEKRFKVGPPDREPPDHEGWKVSAPAAGGTGPLSVTFDESLDEALARRLVWVVTEDGREVAGTASLSDHEKRWAFVPDAPWRAGRYAVVVQTTIEDLAGNNPGKPFEVDLAQGAKRVESRPTVKLNVQVPDAPPAAAAAAPLRLDWKDNILTIRGADLPGGEMKVLYIEAYCRPGSAKRKWEETVIGHKTRLVSSAESGSALTLECALNDGVKVRHEIRAGADEVEFKITANNPTDKPSLAHWAQPCIRVDKFTGRRQHDYLEKCFIFLDGKLSRMPTRAWATEALYTPGQVWYPRHVKAEDVNPRPASAAVPDNGLIGCFSADEKKIFAVAFDPYQELFQGVICCLHSDFRIGGLAPGETKTIRGKIYLVPADVEALLARYRADFPRH